jgi:hypothetical protein
MPFYAVANGRDIGIFSTWDECNNSVKGYKNALYKKFDKRELAEEYIQTNQQNSMVEKVDDFVPDYYVYTDGACSYQSLIEIRSAGCGVWAEQGRIQLSFPLPGTDQTSTRAEIYSVKAAL